MRVKLWGFFYVLLHFSAFKLILKFGAFFLAKWEVVKVVNDHKIEQNNDL